MPPILQTSPASRETAFSTSGLCLIGGRREAGRGAVVRPVRDPADVREVLAEVREAGADQVAEACAAAARAFPAWRAVPAPERARILFRYRELLEQNLADLALSVVRENGKLLDEAKGSVRRGIDVVEFACGIPTQLAGPTLPDVSRDVDTYAFREALGGVAGIPPFNFPAMIPLWMMPVAVACGNAFILKPSEKCPLTATRLAELFEEAGLPPGVVNVLQGGREVAEALIADDRVDAVTSVGSTAAAKAIYRAAGERGKRVQALGGAKNHLVVMPDADLARSLPALIGSFFGCAGQRCLAGSVLVPVGDRARQDAVVDAFVAAARAIRLGRGTDPSAGMGPLHSPEHRDRVVAWIDRGVADGAKLLLDGRAARAEGLPHGGFTGPTVFDDVAPEAAIAREEIFGPVAVVLRAADLDGAIAHIRRSPYGNSASIFTASGAAARAFRERVPCGMLGVNLGVPAPPAFFSFGGWKGSLFGDLHAHGPDAVAFFTRRKVVTERWYGAERPVEGWV